MKNNLGMVAGGICVGAALSSVVWMSIPTDGEEQMDSSQPRVGKETKSRWDAGTRPVTPGDVHQLAGSHISKRTIAELWERSGGMSFQELKKVFYAALNDNTGKSPNPEVLSVLFERLVEIDAKAAATLMAELDPEQIGATMGDLLTAIAAVDSAAALNLYQQMDEAERNAFVIDDFLTVLATTDIATAKELIELISPQDRGRAFELLVNGLSATDPTEALAFLETLSADELANGLGDPKTLGQLAGHDPEVMAKLIEKLPKYQNSSGWKFAKLAEVWATNDPEKALAWTESIELEAIRSKAMFSLYSAWAKINSLNALEALGKINDPSFKRRVFGTVTRAVIKNDPDGAEAWVRGLQDKNQGAYALGLLGSELAKKDPEQGAKLLGEAIKAGDAPLAKPSEDIGYAYALADPTAAATWAMQLEPGDVQTHAVEGVVRAWASRDPVAATEWIASLPPGGSRDGSIYYLVDEIVAADPSTAFSWGSTVQDPDKRLYLLKRATDSWTQHSPQETKLAIEGLSLTERDKSILLSRVRN